MYLFIQVTFTRIQYVVTLVSVEKRDFVLFYYEAGKQR